MDTVSPQLHFLRRPRRRTFIGEVPLPRNATAAPMIYMLNGEQFIVVATGGANLPAELVALRLP